jgi:hypothetical protein
VLGGATAGRLIEAIFALEDTRDIGSLRRLLQRRP